MKILIVEDEPDLVKIYLTKLAGEGFRVETAINGHEGLAKLPIFAPDIILLDILMPKVNGLEMLKALKDLGATTPVILLTNVSESDEAIQKGLELGAVAYLIKSNYTPEQVVTKIKEIAAEYLPRGR